MCNMAILLCIAYSMGFLFSSTHFVSADDSELTFLKEKIITLESKLTQHNSLIMVLDRMLSEQNKKIDTLRSDLSYVGPEFRTKKQGSHILHRILRKQNLMSPRSTKIKRRRRYSIDNSLVNIKGKRPTRGQVNAVGVPVAFYAYLSSDVINPGKQQPLMFNTVKTNIGNAYNGINGQFLVPGKGVYVFTSSIAMNGENQFSSYEIMKNAEVQGTFFVDAQYTDGYKYSSLTIVIHAEAGDVIFVRTGGLYNYIKGSVYSRSFARSSFAGWKIY